ncbi:MAG: hypothetical protein ACRC77_05455 [Bacteroidales bacterium]
MKQNLVFAMLSLLMMACSSSEDVIETPVSPEEAKFIEVNFGLTGEISDITQTPLTRAIDTTTLYGVQVYSQKNGSEHYYAYGLYDNVSKMKIRLVNDQTYRFVCSSVIDAKNILAISEGNWNAPFSLCSNISIPNSHKYNVFYYSTTTYTCGLQYGGSTLYPNWNHYQRPNTDRYYGEVMNYQPVEGGRVQIDMKRMTFGAKFIADGMTEGKLIVSIENAPQMNIEHPDTEVQDIFTFNYLYNISDTTSYNEEVPVAINWEKANGEKVPIAAQKIKFTRNKLTTVTVKVNDSSLQGSIGVTTEDDPMTDGDQVEVGGGSSTETPVDPVTK